MPKPVTVEGIQEAINFLDPKKGVSSVVTSMNDSLTLIDKALRVSLRNKFTARNSPNLLSRSVTSIGNSIVGRLVYEQVYSDLSKFPTTWKMGNINAGARRPGRVHTTTVVRGRSMRVLGKYHRGGFLLLDKSGNPKKYGRYGTQMVERTGDSKLPVHLLLGPSTQIMIAWAFRKDNTIIEAIRRYEVAILQGYFE